MVSFFSDRGCDALAGVGDSPKNPLFHIVVVINIRWLLPCYAVSRNSAFLLCIRVGNHF